MGTAAAGAKYYPLHESKDLDALIDRIGDSRLVLLGEASHGTHEYYTWRSAITRRLIEEKGFNFVAVEGDWPDCYRINRYIKGYADQDKEPKEVLREFDRWPTWMWANWEIDALVSWMKDYNKQKRSGNKTGFYGLDVYSLWESMDALISYLQKHDPPAARIAERAMACFSFYGSDEQLYAEKSLSQSCENDVVRLLTEMRLRAERYNEDPEAALNTLQNAHIAVEAEKYYRNMVTFDEHTWNIRDHHMMSTLKRLIDFHGPKSKAIVWEHNTHVGDARFTDMRNRGLINIGQLARETYGELEPIIVGFGSYHGTVIAGKEWGANMQVMEVPEAKKGSIEYILHNETDQDRLIIFNPEHEEELYSGTHPHRAIGVVYHPDQEQHNYVPTNFSKRYDAFIFIDETTALHPLKVKAEPTQMPATYPFEF